MTNSTEVIPTWEVGQLLGVGHGHTHLPLLELHPFFGQPRQIYGCLMRFWSSHWNKLYFMPPGSTLTTNHTWPEEWSESLRVEGYYDLRQNFGDGSAAPRRVDIWKGSFMLVTNVVVTPWKKKYIHNNIRFAYVELLTQVKGKPKLLHYDISDHWRNLEIDSYRFEVIQPCL